MGDGIKKFSLRELENEHRAIVAYAEGDYNKVYFEAMDKLTKELLRRLKDVPSTLEAVLKMQEAMKLESEWMPKSWQAPKTVDAIGVAVELAKACFKKVKG